MRAQIIGLSLATLALAACSGGGGGGVPATSAPASTSGSSQASARVTDEQAVDVTNGVGTPLRSFATYNENISTATTPSATARTMASAVPNGTCSNGVEFFSPDTKGDADSTETKLFYDAGCTQLARDTVRVFAPTSATSESVTRTTSLYSPGSSTASATRTSTDVIASATFDHNGFPIAADGFTRSGTAELYLAGARTISSGGELVMQASTSGTESFCDDTAGYSDPGSPTIAETYGWAGGVLSGGSRTVNSDGSVTWTATHAGTGYKGAVGSLSLAVGTLNTTCPITTPAYTLAGGTAVGTYSIPVVATYRSGILQSLTVTNATLANGDTLAIATTAGTTAASSNFVVGTIGNGSTTVATFALNAFGDGSLTVTATGAQFLITDWHVVH